MVGFVLIVVVVVIGLMVFLLWSAGRTNVDEDSLEVSNMMTVILETTTECVVREPSYDNFEQLFKSCFDNRRCNNLNKDSCDYLNESLILLMGDIMKSETQILAYQIDLLEKDSEGVSGVYRLIEGNCSSGNVVGSQRVLHLGSEMLIVQMRICKN